MCTSAQWLFKQGNTASVVPPTKPAPYTGNTNGLKFIYKQQLKLYEEYEEHKRNTIKAITVCFDEDLLIDLETDGELIGYTPMEIYTHIKTNFLLAVDTDQEILKTRLLLKAPYDPDHIPQRYYKVISDARILLTALGETVSDEEVKRNAYETFEKHMDLREACRDWRRSSLTTWLEMKKTLQHGNSDEQIRSISNAMSKTSQ